MRHSSTCMIISSLSESDHASLFIKEDKRLNALKFFEFLKRDTKRCVMQPRQEPIAEKTLTVEYKPVKTFHQFPKINIQ